jgi:hypothetical protein
MTSIVVFTSWLTPSPTSLYNASWLQVFNAGLLSMDTTWLIAVSFTPTFCLLGVLWPGSAFFELGFLPGLAPDFARLFLQHWFSRI